MSKNLATLNTLLAGCDTADKLLAAYKSVRPELARTTGGNEPANPAQKLEVLNYCSGAAEFVVRYFLGPSSKIFQTEMLDPGKGKAYNFKTAAELLKKLAPAKDVSYVGYMTAAGTPAHECVFVKTGITWGFYQANRSLGDENITLAAKLNKDKRNWNAPDINEPQFRKFFVALTDPEAAKPYFPFRKVVTVWHLWVYDLSGKNLLV